MKQVIFRFSDKKGAPQCTLNFFATDGSFSHIAFHRPQRVLTAADLLLLNEQIEKRSEQFRADLSFLNPPENLPAPVSNLPAPALKTLFTPGGVKKYGGQLKVYLDGLEASGQMSPEDMKLKKDFFNVLSRLLGHK